MAMRNGLVYTRQFPVELQMRDFDGVGDGRTVFARVVPYGEVIDFVDPYDNGRQKKERFVRGALARQAPMWHVIPLVFEHSDNDRSDFGNTIGYGRKLIEREDGAYATFRLIERDAAKARELMENSHRGLSMEFLAPLGDVGTDGVVERRRVHVRRVACVPEAAYEGAEVLSIREHNGNPLTTPRLDEARSILAEIRRDAADR